MEQKNQDYRKFLIPANVAGIQNLELVARLVVEGFITGLHRSPYHGFSVEFAEHRQYRHGDETKNIDWKVYARTNKYYVKQYEEETNLRAVLAVDSSASMSYASKGMISKFDYAIFLTAALSMLMLRQRDAVGLALYDTEIRKYLPPNSKQSFVTEILKTLASYKPSNNTGTANALDSLAERIKRRGLVIIMSDFFDEKESVLNALKHFRHRNHEVLAFHLLDPREIDFKLGTGATFRDMETGEELVTQPHQIGGAYSDAVKSFIKDIKKECFNHNIDYTMIETSTPFDKALRDYITKRRKV
ncbi:MAG: DUF58 domain-containing protein [Desulfobulbaceae bacterium]|nr:DUF58 domain-containing protein [Candidatus Kapabacteria bacterium]MBS3999193.1 DUF58 domain-containing protein [Desulfobulbaceae bacterium]